MFKIILLISICYTNIVFADEAWQMRRAQERQMQELKRMQRDQQNFTKRENDRILREQKKIADKQRQQNNCLSQGRTNCN